MSFNHNYYYGEQSEQPITVHSTAPNQTRRGPWSPEEDKKLMELISIFGPSNWARISHSLSTRTSKQCRERYHQNLKPTLNRTPISAEEGELIEKLVAKYGKKWAEISRHLNGRSDNAIKNWWNGGANRRRRASLANLKGGDEKSVHPNSVANNEHISPESTSPSAVKQTVSNHPTFNLPSGHPPASHVQPSQYPQVPHLPQISFNTSMFKNGKTKADEHTDKIRTTPPATSHAPGQLPAVNHQVMNQAPFKSSASRSSSFDIGSGNAPLPPIPSNLPSKRRLLDEHPVRRHSVTNTIYQQNNNFLTNSHPNLSSTTSNVAPNTSGNMSPYYGSPLNLSNQNSRSNSITHFDFSLSSTASSRRSSIAPDLFPNPLKDTTANGGHKRNISQHSFNSPLLTPSTRFSVSSGSGMTTNTNVSTNTSPVNISGIKNANSNSSTSIYSIMMKDKPKEKEKEKERERDNSSAYSSSTNPNNENINQGKTEETKISVKSLID